MIGEAFCPAHLTGFFTIRKNNNVQETGSLGAGFSIRLGVNTSVEIEFDATPGMQIKVLGYTSSDTRVSEQIVSEYRKKFRWFSPDTTCNNDVWILFDLFNHAYSRSSSFVSHFKSTMICC